MGLITSARTERDISFPGDTIAQQRTRWEAQAVNFKFGGWAVVQVGLNDLLPAEAAATAIARLQSYVDKIRADIGYGTALIISQMIPCKQRLTDIYGGVDGLVAQQKWVDINAAIAGTGPTPITGVDARVTSHVVPMGDGAGNLAAAYDTGDHIHPNTAGRTVNKNAIETIIQSLGLTI